MSDEPNPHLNSRPSSLLNRAAVKKYTLVMCEKLRPGHKWTRISQEWLVNLEGELRNIIQRKVQQLPSVGKTVSD